MLGKGTISRAHFRNCGNVWCHVLLLLRLLEGYTLGASGTHLCVQELVGPRKLHQKAPPPKQFHFSGATWVSCSQDVLICSDMFRSIAFCWIPGPIFNGIGCVENLWHVFTIVHILGCSYVMQPFYRKTYCAHGHHVKLFRLHLKFRSMSGGPHRGPPALALSSKKQQLDFIILLALVGHYILFRKLFENDVWIGLPCE